MPVIFVINIRACVSEYLVQARVWDSVSGECLHTLTGHTRNVTAVRFNHEGSRIVTGSDDNTVRLSVFRFHERRV